jgi:hypothetical protein
MARKKACDKCGDKITIPDKFERVVRGKKGAEVAPGGRFYCWEHL